MSNSHRCSAEHSPDSDWTDPGRTARTPRHWWLRIAPQRVRSWSWSFESLLEIGSLILEVACSSLLLVKSQCSMYGSGGFTPSSALLPPSGAHLPNSRRQSAY